MSSEDFFRDAETRHTIFMQRFAGGQVKALTKYLEQVRREIKKQLKGKDISALSRVRLNKLLAEVDKATRAPFTALSKEFVSEMTEFAIYEADFGTRMLEKGSTAEFKTPSQKAIEAALAKEFIKPSPSTKFTLESLVGAYIGSKRKEIKKLLRDGYNQGKTVNQITDDLENVIRGKQRRELRTLAITATNKISDQMRLLTYRENRDIVTEEKWVSVLDNRTSSGCQALDGEIFPLGRGIRPGYHWNCRSNRIPVVAEEYQLPIKSKRTARGPDGKSKLTRDKKYGTWLAQQPKSFQEEALGKTKAKLFREGGLSLDKFVDHNYQELTLAQLRRREPMAFEKADLD